MSFFDRMKKAAEALTEPTEASLPSSEDSGTSNLKSIFSDSATKIKDVIPTGASVKTSLIKQAVTTDYGKLEQSINLASGEVPATDCLIPVIDVLKLASETYNESTSENREDEFVNCLIENIDAEAVLKEVEPYIQLIPSGNYIVLILRMIVKWTK